MRHFSTILLLLFTVMLVTPQAPALAKAKKGVYRHVVLFAFNEDVTKEQIKERLGKLLGAETPDYSMKDK